MVSQSWYLVGQGEAFGWPGLEPRWAAGAKQGVGTACSGRSRVWFTIAEGILTEIFYPRVDTANSRDLQFLVTDGVSFVHEERRDLHHTVSYADPRAPAYLIASIDPTGAYLLSKVIVTDPQADAVVMRVKFQPLAPAARRYQLFLLFAPHVKNRGYGNSARVLASGRDRLLVASREEVVTAVAASVPFRKASAGFVGHSDGWQDLHDNFRMDWEFATATEGNVALTAELDLRRRGEFTVVIAFGHADDEACRAALECTRNRFSDIMERYVAEWQDWCGGLLDLRREARDSGRILCTSAMVLRIHQDKTEKGAGVASLAIPWGDLAGDADVGSYHLAWPRDLYKAALGFLALDDQASAGAILEYLRRTQAGDGHWAQNFWLDGAPRWQGIQLDETAYPVLLAWRLVQLGAIEAATVAGMVRRAATCLLRYGPVTEQERWEENSGFSPSTIAAVITALVCAADLLELCGEAGAAVYLQEIADAWAMRIEEWTFTRCGALVPGQPEHYERIASIAPSALDRGGTECRVFLPVRNLPPEVARGISQCCVVDGGFLELVRFGLRAPDDPHVLKTLAVYDIVLGVDTPYGPAWHRYNHDGYGEKTDGSGYDGTGIGRAWPLLTGERGQYELAAGKPVDTFVTAMERFANDGGMLPEQIWDAGDIPAQGLRKGKGTGSATPLVWAHAEYLMLLRSKREGCPFERIETVYDRYVRGRWTSALQLWRFTLPLSDFNRGERLRVQLDAPAVVRWSADGWATVRDDTTQATGLGVHYFDFPPEVDGHDVVFTFYWPAADRWEGRNFVVQASR